MSEEKSNATNLGGETDDLNALLQSALDDFDDPTLTTNEESNSNTKSEKKTTEPKSSSTKEELNEDFENKFASLLLGDADDTTFSNQMSDLLKNMQSEIGQFTSENATTDNGTSDTVNEAINSMLQNFEQMKDSMMNESQSPLTDSLDMGVPIMGELFQTLMSKQVLYPSLVGVKQKYPIWLEENKDKIAADEYTRYTDQYNIIKQICDMFESEKDTDNNEVKQKRFNDLFNLLQEMTNLGQPPSEFNESDVGMPMPNMFAAAGGGDPNTCNPM